MTLTISVKTHTLTVSGASIYYETRGSGPVLLMMPGGPATSSVFGRIAAELAPYFTVVTYDPRGLSRSTLDSPIDDARLVSIFADDAHRLIAAVTSEPAFVFGNSGGAVIGLELMARHPGQVRTLVAHEPPSPDLLPDGDADRAGMERVLDAYRSGGVWAGMQTFMASIGVRGGPPPASAGEPTAEAREAMAQMERNFDFFLGHYFRALADYRPDFAVLEREASRIVPAVGQESAGQLANRGGLGLADRLGTKATVFPGAHGGFDSHPVEFAKKLGEVFEG